MQVMRLSHERQLWWAHQVSIDDIAIRRVPFLIDFCNTNTRFQGFICILNQSNWASLFFSGKTILDIIFILLVFIIAGGKYKYQCKSKPGSRWRRPVQFSNNYSMHKLMTCRQVEILFPGHTSWLKPSPFLQIQSSKRPVNLQCELKLYSKIFS